MNSKIPISAYPHPTPPPYGNAQYNPPPYNQPMYNQPQPPQVIIQQPGIGIQTTNVGPDPLQTTCPSCRAVIITNIRHEPTTKTHLMALCLFCFVCWPCVCLPYCMDSCQNANHYCPNCETFIGTYES